MELKRLIESLLFISGRSLSVNKMAEILQQDRKEVTAAADNLMQEYDSAERGIRIQKAGQSYQMASHAQAAGVIKEFVKSEQSGELTKPSLETLTIIAYRGPITKAELEQIRGVNCSLIIRNLLIKGLVEATESREKMTTVYNITLDFLKFLGLDTVTELPDFQRLNSDESLRKLLEGKITEPESTGPASTQ